jgi:protein-S-isoprenylcysteine O-methyltransferase Ste14
MRASHLEFRLRVAIMFVLIALGFWAPWIEAWGIGRRITLLEWLALELSRLGLLPFTLATPVVIVLAALIAALGVVLRVWGTACLGSDTVNSMQMRAGVLMAAGPYRYVRNPLYLGTACMIAAMAFVMPPTGALVVVVVLGIFLFRLILGEEAFLRERLGEPYKLYLHAVPRLIPRLRTNLPPAPVRPHWLRSIVAEINPIGVFVTMAFLSWQYDHWLMIRAILITFGVSLVMRALMPVRTDSPRADSTQADSIQADSIKSGV